MPILQTRVPALFPSRGPVRVLLLGEAPGPRGADRSGIPFWGDRAGQLVYRALVSANMATVPLSAWAHWDGAELKRLGLRPRLEGAALSNAVPYCPTKNGATFCAPSDAELRQPANQRRLAKEIRRAANRAPGTLSVIALGRRSQWVLEKIRQRGASPAFALHGLPHPSAQGLLMSAPMKGKGMKLVDLQNQWESALVRLLRDAT